MNQSERERERESSHGIAVVERCVPCMCQTGQVLYRTEVSNPQL